MKRQHNPLRFLLVLATIIALIAVSVYLCSKFTGYKRDEFAGIASTILRDTSNSNWDKAVLEKYSSKELIDIINGKDAFDGIVTLQVFGNFVKLKDVDYRFIVDAASISGTAEYANDSDTNFEMELVKRDGKWQLTKIYLHSKTLKDPLKNDSK